MSTVTLEERLTEEMYGMVLTFKNSLFSMMVATPG